jgi:hypothetical protein
MNRMVVITRKAALEEVGIKYQNDGMGTMTCVMWVMTVFFNTSAKYIPAAKIDIAPKREDGTEPPFQPSGTV